MAAESILVIDDNPVNIKLARAVLARAGYTVHVAGDAHAALASLEQDRPALIITDLELPDVSGFELVTRLKQDERYRRLPVIAMTASSLTDDEVRARAAGCDGYLTKPFEIDALLALVTKLLTDLPA